MPAAVLCDGAPSALKAVELGGYPNFFVSPTDQLILLHTSSPLRMQHFLATQNGSVLPPSAAAGGTGGSGAGQGKDSSPSQNTPAFASTTQPITTSASGVGSALGGAMATAATSIFLPPPVPLTSAAESIRNAMATITSEIPEWQRSCLPTPLTLYQHLHSIKESRFLKDFLNYKVETASLPLPSPAVPKPEEEPRNPGGRNKGSGRMSSVKPIREEAQPEPMTLEEVTFSTAFQTADYVRQRAVHHKLDTLLLGVGNQGEGKAITIGHTAEAVLQQLRSQFYLYFIKNEGFTLRPSSTLIRYVVIVTVKNGSPPPPPPLLFIENGQSDGKDLHSFAPQEGGCSHSVSNEHTRSSLVDYQDSAAGGFFRSGGQHQPYVVHVLETGPHPSSLTMPLSSPNALQGGTAAGSPSKAATSAGPLHSPFGAPPPDSPSFLQKRVDALEDGLAAVRYALARRRAGTRDAVGVLLVVEPQMEEMAVKQYVSAFEKEIQQAPVLYGGTEKEEEEKESILKSENVTGTAGFVTPEKRLSLQSSEVIASVEKTKEGAFPSSTPLPTTEDGSPSDAGPKADELWPPVTICSLKVTKHLPNPTVWNSTPQVIKSLQQRRVEFAVFASSAPDPMVHAVLTHHKPHVVIVPPPSSVDPAGSLSLAATVRRATSWTTA